MTPAPITSRAQLVELAGQLGVRPDWHEPDEQGLTAVVAGTTFDNAMPPGGWYGTPPHAELHVTLFQESDVDGTPQPVAVVNLAILFAWATGFDHKAETRNSGHPNALYRALGHQLADDEAQLSRLKLRMERGSLGPLELTRAAFCAERVAVLERVLAAAGVLA